MKLLIDPEIFFNGRCGMVRYYSVLFKELKNRGIDIDLPLLLSGSDFIAGRLQFMEKAKTVFVKARAWNRLRSFLNRVSLKRYYQKLKQGQYDAVFVTSPVFDDRFLTHLPGNKPTMMVVHDTMRCVLAPDGLYDPSGSNADKLAYLIHNVTTVFAISNQTKEDIVSLTRMEDSHIKVIHTGNLLQHDAERPVHDLPERFLLFVGDRTGRKNFRFLVHSISAWLREEQPDLYLVCTGHTNKWEQALLEKHGIQDRVLFRDAPDDVLVHLYKHATALIFPSLYEGFGLPVLEAMALGCPVVTSAAGALLEVGGQAVVYVDPSDSASILEGVQRIVNHPAYRQERIRAGLVQSQRFALSSMVDLFQEAIEQSVADSHEKLAKY